MNRTATALLALLLISCSSSSPQKDAPEKDTGLAKDTTTEADTAPEEAAEKEPEGPGPLKAPAAYFGDLGFDRLDEAVEVAARKKDSIILLVADTMNARHLSVYGYERPTSENIDALARDGVLYTNYISNSSWTRPSMTTIMTGLPKKDHKVELNGPPVVASIETLAERFRKEGYVTYGISGNPLIRERWGYDQGFRYWHDVKSLGTKGFPPDQVLMRPVIKWLETVEDEPFFLMMFLTAPHPPYRPLPEWRKFLKTVPRGEINEHPFKEYREPLPEDEHDRIVAAYDDEVRYMDHLIGDLVATLKERGRAGNTSIMFTADHGEMFGQHNCYLHSYHMYEQTLHLPMIIHSPRVPVKKVYDDRPFTHIDIAPTLMDLAGLQVPKDLPGKSMIAAMADPDGHRERILFSQYNAHGVRREAVRNARHKLVHHHKVEARAAHALNELHPSLDNRPDPRNLPSLAWDEEKWKYFDLVEDPEESEDVYAEHKDSAEVKELVAAIEEHADIEVEKTAELSEELLEALEAAGYINRDDQKKDFVEVSVIKDDVRVRETPVDGRVVDKISKGDKVRYYEGDAPDQEGWCRIATTGKQDGYAICSALDLR